MNIFIALDSFKGSISSIDANRILYDTLKGNYDVQYKAIGDGGEGTLEALVDSLDGEMIKVRVRGPKNNIIDSEYAICNDIAIIEMSKCSGLTLLKKEELNPLYMTTYGVGEMIIDALDKGCRKFIICIGGSATNDGGTGMLSALGYRFYNDRHELISKNALGLKDLYYIDKEHYDRRLDECEFEVASDVTNPLCGIDGASYIFARQKGANDEEIKMMDEWLYRYAKISGYDEKARGCGAAGGLGYALKYYLNAKMTKGIDLVIKNLNIEDIIKSSDIIICGEGKIDIQTLSGKAPMGIASLAKKHHKKTIAIAGKIEYDKRLEKYFDSYYEIMNYSNDKDDAILNVKEYLKIIAKDIINDIG